VLRAVLKNGNFGLAAPDRDSSGQIRCAEIKAKMAAEERVNFVAFTGSVAGGYAVQQAASGRFVGVGLELGGKDPAYIRADANLDHAIENVIDGAMFNSGQSCCAVERIYVHRDVYDQFVDGAVALTNQYILGDPLNHETTLGPVVRQRSADLIRAHIAEAISCGAKALIDEARFPRAQHNTPYVAPQILVNVDHSMRVMTEETFGPVVGVMPVSSDEEAIQLMNDSVYGLTASVWTADVDAAIRIGEELETGTVFMNRCDYLDPALAWTGVKQSGRGVSLSELGYEQLTQPKSFHLRTEI
jgi:acyl-CoA reductase-like NAD-dependent aldehyde dehydrogenase